MIDYFLDTNACLALINGTSVSVRRRFRQAIDGEKTVAVSSVVMHELWYGVDKSQRRDFNTQRLAPRPSWIGWVFGVSASDPVTLALVAAALAFVALVASLVPAYRASRLDRLTVLRDH